MGVPSWMTVEDAKLNLDGDLLVILTKYGGKQILAGPEMDSMLKEFSDYILTERCRDYVEFIGGE